MSEPGQVGPSIDPVALLARPIWPLDPHRQDDILAGARVMVTGAGGSIGRALVARIAAAGPARLLVVESHEPSLFYVRDGLRRHTALERARFLLVDARDRQKLAAVLGEERPELVIHLAAYKHVPLGEENADQVLSVNVRATLDLAELALRAGARRFVYPSTDKAVRPPSIYGATKRVAELGLAALRVSWGAAAIGIARLVNVFGTQGSVVDTFARQLGAGRPITITDDRMTRYWMTMEETVGLLVHAGHLAPTELAFMLDVGEPVPLLETARAIHRLLAPTTTFDYDLIGPRPGERLHEELTYAFERAVATPVPGLLRVESPDVLRGDGAAFLDAVAELSARAPGLTPAAIKDALFGLLAATSPPELSPPGTSAR